MFSIFKRKLAPAKALPFNQRVDAFWGWFQNEASRIYAAIDEGKCSSLVDEVSRMVNELSPGFAWVFGPGADGIGHSFTLSGEGVIHRQLLALQWLSRAPVINGWTFYAARQPGPISGHTIEIYNLKFSPREIWVTPSINEEQENIDITVWHSAWDQIDPSQKSTVTFLYLDESLGEYGTDWWIGRVEFGRDRLAASIPLEELTSFVESTAKERGWKKHLPGELWALYKTKQSSADFPRSDILTQNTCIPKLFTSFMESAGQLEDPLLGSGADYVFISIDEAYFPKGEEVSLRGKIEDAVEKALANFGGGRCIGGALGSDRSYSDFLIFEGERSLSVIRDTLKEFNVPSGTMIEFFAHEKRGRRIAL